MADATIPNGGATDNGADKHLRLMHGIEIEEAQIGLDVLRKKLAFLFEVGAQRRFPELGLSDEATEGLLHLVENLYREAELAHESILRGMHVNVKVPSRPS